MPEEISVKIVIIGEPAVGKTTLRKSFVGAEMKGSFLMTLGVDIANSKIKINDNLILDAQLWDIAGQESWGPMTRQFLQGAQGAIIVFDLTRDYTFDKLDEWLKKLHEENPKLNSNIPFLVVGNKADLDGFIKMSDDQVYNYLEFINRHHVYAKTDAEFIRTSAKTGHKVKEAFHRMGEIIVENFRQVEIEEGGSKFKDLLGSVQSENDLLGKQFVKVDEEEEKPAEKAPPRRLTVQEMIAQREAKRAGRDPTKPFHQEDNKQASQPKPKKEPLYNPNKPKFSAPIANVSKPMGTPEPTVSNPMGTPEPTVSKPMGTPEPTVSKPMGTPEPTVSKPMGTPEPTVSKPIGATPTPSVSSQKDDDDALSKILGGNVMDDIVSDPTTTQETKKPIFNSEPNSQKKSDSLSAPEPSIRREKKEEEEDDE